MVKKGGGKGNTVSVVTDLVMPLIEQQNLILWDVRFEKEGSMWLLRIIIDKKPDGVSIDDCEALSRPLDKILDEVDPIDQSYCLEVASAGLERDLSKPWHFEESIGRRIQIKLIRPIDGEREFVGSLSAYDENSRTVTIELGDKGNESKKEFQLNDTAFIRWYVEF